jgi:hypothetical protein
MPWECPAAKTRARPARSREVTRLAHDQYSSLTGLLKAARGTTWPGQVSVATLSMDARWWGRAPDMTGDTPAVSGSSKY